MNRIKVSTLLAVFVLAVTANYVLAETWSGGDMTWSEPDIDSFDVQYDIGDTATFTATGAGTVTVDAGGVNPGAVVVNSTAAYIFTGGSIGGAGSLTKSGSGTLTLSGTNSYSGGTVINEGSIFLSTDGNLGATSGGLAFNGNGRITYSDGLVLSADRTVMINNGASVSLSNRITVNGILTGAGGFSVNTADGFYFTNPNNDYSGTITAATAGSTGYGLDMVSIGDTAGAGLINLGITTSGGTFRWIKDSGGTTTFANRQFALSGTTGGGVISALGASSAENLIINNDLLITGVGNKTLTLAGTNTGANRFAGAITNEPSSAVSLTKTEAGTWALAGTNTYSGATSLAASATTGKLVFQGSQSLSPNTTLAFAQASSNVQSIRFLDDAVGTINFGRPITFGGSNTSQILGIFAGNNHTANLGNNPSSTTTDSIIQAGIITFTSVAGDTATTTISVTGANGYRLATGTITLNNLVARNVGQTTTTVLNPTTANITVSDVTMATGNQGRAVDGIPVLQLGGTSTDNYITGTISDASDYLTGEPLSITKTGGSTWTLSGENTFSGTTTISGGTLILAGGECLSDTNRLTITGTGANQIHLNEGVQEKVGLLTLGTTPQDPGVYGSSASGAANTNDTYFAVAGTGRLYVGVEIPAAGTIFIIK